MNRFRFSLAGLLGFVTVAAIGLLALRNASELWGQVMFTSAVAVLLFAVLAAIYRRSHARAFWVGFLVFGWAYMLLVYGPWFEQHVGRRLATAGLLDRLHKTFLQRTEEPTVPRVAANVLQQLQAASGRQPGPSGFGNAQGQRTQAQQPVITLRQRGQLTPERTRGVRLTTGPALAHVQTVGHPLFALLFALAGGVAGRWVYGGKDGKQ